MKTTLILFDTLSDRNRRGLGFASLKLAEKFLEDGLLDQVICMGLDRDVDIFGDRAHVLLRNPLHRWLCWVTAKLARVFSGLKPRKVHVFLFDRFARDHLQCRTDTILFVSRPLFNRTIDKAKAHGMRVWVQSSVAHPLLNYALVKNEEYRLGLATKGHYSDVGWTKTIAQAVLQADRIITLDPAIGRFTYDSYRVFFEPRRLLTLKKPQGIDTAEFTTVAKRRRPKTPGEEIVFGHVSHMNLIKGVHYLLEAWRLFQQGEVPQCRLVLGGRMDHNVRQMIKDRYSDLANVDYPGYLPDLVEYLGKVDVFVSPSISDAGPATIFEAMAAGVPVISSLNCGYASLITDQVDGFTYPFNDISRLAEILGWFREHSEEICLMGNRARNKMENLSSGQYAEEIRRLIEDFSNPGQGN